MDRWKKFFLYLTAAASWFSTQTGMTAVHNSSIDQNEFSDRNSDEIYLKQVKRVRSNDGRVASQIDELFEDELDETMNYGHRSHSSHRSHYSGASGRHTSHISHQSHYSGSGGYYDDDYSGSSSGGSSRGGSSSGGSSSAPTPKKDIIPVIEIQRQLNILGYNCGTEDGQKGAATVNAIKNFQIEYGLPADGIVDWKTESWLNSTKIDAIREALQKFGYKFNPALGNGRTKEVADAIYDFQVKNNLDANGRIDLKTKRALGLGG